ncbi:MAG: tetratricopeptide repeat protein, partial [Acidiferrobacterales bacterium]
GDGLLAEFASVVDAVRCAVAFQEGMRERNESVQENRRIEFRIGLNLGDVIVQDDDVFGDGVNVAARLEGLAEPGGVVVSSSVHEQVNYKLDLRFDDLGPQHVKNIREPVRALSIRALKESGPTPPQRPDDALPEPEKPSIAVLPFDNISNDPEQEYFSDGITEDIITELSMISGLFVIARHSSFTYKGQPVTLKQVGRELGVRYVLEGSVRKAGNRLRITAQLIDSATDHHLWAERYDRDLEDIFAVQEEVARSVAAALAVALKPNEGERLCCAPTDNIEAYDLYLRTRATPWPPTRENILTARKAYEHLAEIDPNFVGGHAGSALTYAMAVIFGASPRPETDAEIAIAKAKRALALNEGFAPAHSALGLGYLAAGRHDEAVTSARKATELQPSDADAHFYLGVTLLFAGDGDKACEAAERALRIDPQFTNGPYLNLLGIAKFLAGRYAEAIEAFKRNVARGGPMGASMLHPWVAAYVAEGRIEEAHDTAKELLTFFPEFSLKRFRMLHIYKNEEDSQRLIGYLRKAGLPE